MAIKGFFRQQTAVMPSGIQRKIVTLMLTNSNWLGHEQFDVVFSDMGHVNTATFDIELKAGQSIELDVRNTGWDWCMGDYAAIVDKKGREQQRWDFKPRIYGPGECPECHGTRRCAACQGRGQWPDRTNRLVICHNCMGSGQCQTCYVPVRGANDSFPGPTASVTPSQDFGQSTPRRHHRPTAVIQGEIKRKERELEQVNRDLQRRTDPAPQEVLRTGWPYPGSTIYVKPKGDFSSFTYAQARRSAQLEWELRQLYQELADAEADVRTLNTSL